MGRWLDPSHSLFAIPMALAIHAAMAIHPVGAVAIAVKTVKQFTAGPARRTGGAARGDHSQDKPEHGETQSE